MVHKQLEELNMFPQVGTGGTDFAVIPDIMIIRFLLTARHKNIKANSFI